MDNKQEFQLRRLAIRLWLYGAKPKVILQKVQQGADMVEQMAPTVRPSWGSGSQKRVAPPPAHAHRLSGLDRASDPPNASAFGETKGGADWPARYPTRTEGPEVGQAIAFAAYDQAGVAQARTGRHGERYGPGLLSETVAHGVGPTAGDGLEVSLSDPGPQGVCVSFSQLANASVP